MIYGNSIGGVGLERTYLLIDEEGNQAVGVMVDKDTELDATANDIRKDKTAATVDGLTVGTKVIPSYHTSEGYWMIAPGADISIPLASADGYDFTRLQVLICLFNGNLSGSVAAEKVAINEAVYPVSSTEKIATVTKDSTNKTINLGLTNDSPTDLVLRYITYKEIV